MTRGDVTRVVPDAAEPIGPLASPGYWLLQAAQRWKLEFTRDARDLGLTQTQFQILASVGWLEHQGQTPTQQQVADQAGTDRMMTSKVVAGLEARGLVRREVQGRVKHLALTQPGRAVTARATAIARGVDARLFRGTWPLPHQAPTEQESAPPNTARDLLRRIATDAPD